MDKFLSPSPFSNSLLDSEPSEDAIEALVRDVNIFIEIDHWYWGLWAIVQGKAEGVETFDYFEYAKRRFQQFALLHPSART